MLTHFGVNCMPFWAYSCCPYRACSNYCDAYSPATRVTAAQWAAFRNFLAAADMLGTSNYPNGEHSTQHTAEERMLCLQQVLAWASALAASQRAQLDAAAFDLCHTESDA